MDSKSDNIEILTNGEADEVIKELFDLLKKRFQNNLKSIKGSEFVFDYAYLFYYKYREINPKCGGSYMDSTDWIKKEVEQLILSIKKIINAFNTL